MVNRVILLGRLTADPEVKATATGMFVANLRLATNTYAGKDEEGKAKEHTEFHQLVMFGRHAEVAGTFLSKGRMVYIDGRLQTSSWEDPAGAKRYRTEVVVDSFHMLGAKPEEAAA